MSDTRYEYRSPDLPGFDTYDSAYEVELAIERRRERLGLEYESTIERRLVGEWEECPK